MFNSGDFSQDRTILKSIVSLFFNLDYDEELVIQRSRLISELLNNLLGKSYDPRIIVELAENPYPIRQSVNIINQEFAYSDKFVLLLNIFYYSHVNKMNKSVNGCIDLVKIVDILRMKISLYDIIFDFLEGKLPEIPLDKDLFSTSLAEARFTNYLIFCNQGGDIDIKSKDICLCFIKITENQIYKVVINKGANSAELTSFKDQEIIKLEYEITISKRFIATAYSQKLNETSELIEVEELPDQVFYRKHNHIYLLDKKNKKHKNILNNSKLCYIDDKLSPESEILGIEVFNQRKISRNTSLVLYLIDYGNELIVTEKKLENAIAVLSLKNGEMEFETLSSELLVNNINQKEKLNLRVNEDLITWKGNSYKFSPTGELVASNVSFNELNVNRLRHKFKDSSSLALTNINFSLKNGELLSIMGPSGSGKTTLLKVLNGEMKADEADISIDGLDFMDNFQQIIKNVGYVPQSDLLFTNLTVYQNIYYYAKVRSSGKIQGIILRNRIERVLKKVGLFEKRNHIVGNEEKKVLSGGERRRLNIALELIFEPAIIILDEPTSGLSSKDSEQILSILRDLANNGKMIITTIHQPNPKIFASFDKLLFLDRQGVVVYFGDAADVFSYFNDELKQIIVGKEEIEKKKNLMMVDFVFDILEYKGYSNEAWNKTEKRFFPPDHWISKRDRFLIGDLMTKKSSETSSHRFKNQKKNSFKDNINQFYYCLRRNIINTLFSKINLVMLLFVPLVLGLFCAILLKKSDVLTYSFGNNPNIPIFNFISILVFIFLGMAGSLYDIQPEKLIIVREKKVGLLASNYLLAKVLTLLSFTIIQVIIYTLVAQEILGFKGHFTIYFMLLTLSGFCGISIGLFASASIPDKRGLLMTLPLALIPMIIFGGAIIPFSTMNPSLTISSQREVPEFCELIPTKWLFEALTLTSIHENSYSRQIAKFDSLLSKTDGADKKSQINDQKYDFLMSRNRDEYINRMNEKLADQAYIKYLNKRGNYYLSEKYPIFNKELKSSSLAIIMSIVLSLIFNGLTLLKIKEF
ncbi:ATP-binding cassette domain-containing protein [bacterium]|nr:ATP-binding cassette domain-containing protein [bacterium]